MAVWQSPRDSRAPLTCEQCTTLAESVSSPSCSCMAHEDSIMLDQPLHMQTTACNQACAIEASRRFLLLSSAHAAQQRLHGRRKGPSLHPACPASLPTKIQCMKQLPNEWKCVYLPMVASFSIC